MANTEREVDKARRSRVALVALGAMVAVAGVILYLGLRSPPQMGASEKVFNTVDALYTAVRNEDERRTGECEQRLRSYREAGLLPPDAADALNAIIATAKAGRWRSAAESLYDFMKGQRREGVIEHDHDKTAKPPKGKGK